jgi:apolipoprotein N-acyltransferase
MVDAGGRIGSVARPLAVIGLSGMAYCHIKDVGMKFDEHVYYMATLFCCNIAASLALIPAVLWVERLPARSQALVWAATGALAALTIVGFVWSRTIGFPQMADHVGEWDTLGLTSVGFEVLVVVVSGWMLAALPREEARPAPASMIGAQ